jgi:hypothetical protein
MIESRSLEWDPVQWSEEVKIHAILCLLGWGFLLPVSIFALSHLTRRTGQLHGFGIHFHMFVGTLGLIFALAGFGYGIRRFTTFSREGVTKYRYAHAVVGTIATAGAILQVLLMIFMRKPEYHGQAYTTWPLWQKVGHFGHRGLGFLWLFFALVALETGTHITNVTHIESLANRDEMYSAGLIGTTIATAMAVACTVQFAIFYYPVQVTHDEQVEVPKGNAESGNAAEIA